MHILVIEDEPAIADFLVRGLEGEGYSVSHEADGAAGEARALAGDVDLVILDLMLPGRDGLGVLQAVRRVHPELPVILLTARDEVADKVGGLDSGANDYMTKPFSFPELAARVRAHLRQPSREPGTRLRAGDLEANLVTREVSWRGEPVRLSPTEFDLLAFFMRHPGRVVSRDELLRGVWGYDFDPGTNIVGVYVGYLRRKLAGAAGEAPIDTVRGAGYRLRA